MSFEERFGMVQLPPPLNEREYAAADTTAAATATATAALKPSTPPLCVDVHGRPIPETPYPVSGSAVRLSTYTPYRKLVASSPVLSRNFMNYYVQQGDHLTAVTTAAYFVRQTSSPASASSPMTTATASSSSAAAALRDTEGEEYFLWSLFETLLHEEQRSVAFHPEVIGVHNTPPRRRWFISQYAHIQHLLMTQPVLRVANTICMWLEEAYRQAHPSDPRLHSSEEPVILRQLLLTYIRGGELHKAIDAAVTCRDCAYTCWLSAAQLQTVEEAWMTETRVVPLFGEYGHGALAQSWTGNSHRLDNLSQLFEESSKPLQDGHRAVGGSGSSHSQLSFEAVIAAVLCGNVNVMESAFLGKGPQRWQDILWVHLRCHLIIAFTRQLMAAGHHVEPRYATYIHGFTGTHDNWEADFTQKMVQGLIERLQACRLLAGRAPTIDTLQLRVVLQTLSSAANLRQREWFKDLVVTPGNGDEARRLSHVFLLLDSAYRESLLRHSVQTYAAEELCAAMCHHAAHLALLPLQQPTSSSPAASGSGRSSPGLMHRHVENMHGVVALVLRLHDPLHRAHVYASFLFAVREVELEREDRPREAVEEEEFQMTRLFVEADPAAAVVRNEVMRVLDQKVVAKEDMLTHHKNTERLLWEAMHATQQEDYEEVLNHCLEGAQSFWCAAVQPVVGVVSGGKAAQTTTHALESLDMNAIVDINRILQQRVLPYLLLVQRRGEEEVTVRVHHHFQASSFWKCFAEAYETAIQHTRVAGELAVVVTARSDAIMRSSGATTTGGSAAALLDTTADHQLRHRLSQQEGSLLLRLIQCTREAIPLLSAVLSHPTTSSPIIATAAIYLVQQLTEDIVISLMAHASDSDVVYAPFDETERGEEEEEAEEEDTPAASSFKKVRSNNNHNHNQNNTNNDNADEDVDDRSALSLVRLVFALVEELDERGYLTPEQVPPYMAQALFTKIRTLRVTYAKRKHAKQIQIALQQEAELQSLIS